MSADQTDGAFPVIRVGHIEPDPTPQRWLVDQLWAKNAVGIIGGPPKCCKTWLSLDLSLSVASGTPCLGRYEVHDSGDVLIYAAEDSLRAIRDRLASLAASRELELELLPVFAITVTQLRLDCEKDCRRLEQTIARIRPRLLVLDPLIRLHRIDENSASEISGLLAFLRQLQRRFDLAVMLVHHARKAGHNGQAGQALRGSGDLHAFGDSNLYLRRRSDLLILTAEHRSAHSPDPVGLTLAGVHDGKPHLALCNKPHDENGAALLRDQIIEVLRKADGPLWQQDLRDIMACRNQTLGEAMHALKTEGLIQRTRSGWQITK